MYYRYDCDDAYKAKNQYIFGGELIVCPITAPADKKLNLASVDVWLPDGRWTDIFNGRIYEGGKWIKMYRDIDSIPVRAPAGAIVPMYKNDRSNDLSLEQPLEINIWRGEGSYELYEDDGETMDYKSGKSAITRFELCEDGSTLRLTITPDDPCEILPAEREFVIKFRDIVAKDMTIKVGREPISIEIKDVCPKKNEDIKELKNAILTRVQGTNAWKERNFNDKKMPKFIKEVFEEFEAMI
jgi:hypothetical protein